jgi:hypothetical protein
VYAFAVTLGIIEEDGSWITQPINCIRAEIATSPEPTH